MTEVLDAPKADDSANLVEQAIAASAQVNLAVAEAISRISASAKSDSLGQRTAKFAASLSEIRERMLFTYKVAEMVNMDSQIAQLRQGIAPSFSASLPLLRSVVQQLTENERIFDLKSRDERRKGAHGYALNKKLLDQLAGIEDLILDTLAIIDPVPEGDYWSEVAKTEGQEGADRVKRLADSLSENPERFSLPEFDKRHGIK